MYPWVAPKQEAKPITFRIDDSNNYFYIIINYLYNHFFIDMGLKAATDEILVGQVRTHDCHTYIT